MNILNKKTLTTALMLSTVALTFVLANPLAPASISLARPAFRLLLRQKTAVVKAIAAVAIPAVMVRPEARRRATTPATITVRTIAVMTTVRTMMPMTITVHITVATIMVRIAEGMMTAPQRAIIMATVRPMTIAITATTGRKTASRRQTVLLPV